MTDHAAGVPLGTRLIIDAMSPRDLSATLAMRLAPDHALAGPEARDYMCARLNEAIDAVVALEPTDRGPGEDAVHLGDGAYATFDGWCVWLWAQRENGWHRVALEPSGLAALVRYAHSKGIDPEDKP